MYNIILKNGKTINIKATKMQKCQYSKNEIILFDGSTVVAKFNMDNIAGWIRC